MSEDLGVKKRCETERARCPDESRDELGWAPSTDFHAGKISAPFLRLVRAKFYSLIIV